MFQDIPLYIKQKNSKNTAKGVLVYEYILSNENSFTQDKLYHEGIIGLSLKGRVLEAIQDTVKVQLEIDAEQTKKEEAYPSLYTTSYTAEGNSGWYCMPEVDDTVMIYFPTKEEKDAVGVNSIENVGKRWRQNERPSSKIFQNKKRKRIKI